MSLLVATNDRERNKAVLDASSAVSGAIGLVAGVANVNPAMLIVSLVVYEAAASGGMFTRPTQRLESPANRIGDVLVGVLGYAAGEWIRTRRPQWLATTRDYLNGSGSENV